MIKKSLKIPIGILKRNKLTTSLLLVPHFGSEQEWPHPDFGGDGSGIFAPKLHINEQILDDTIIILFSESSIMRANAKVSGLDILHNNTFRNLYIVKRTSFTDSYESAADMTSLQIMTS